ncbi:MAG: VWA domain-containing protein [bacterium]|nr:VWA domain-containing protein [bacterium]
MIAVLALVAVLAIPQDQPPPVDVGELPTIKVDVDVVNVLCSVRDKRGGLISNLSQEDFLITEDGSEQEIRYFARETDLPLTIGMLIDVSKSQENLIETEKFAGSRFFSEVLRMKDMAFLISFGVEVELLQDFTGSPRLLREGLDELRLNAAVGGVLPGPVPTANRKGTVLYDAIFLAAEDRLKREVGRKVIVLISDGMDYGSTMSKHRAIEAAQRSDAIIYSIYYADPRYQQFGHGYGDLKKMSQETGGRVFRVSRKNSLEYIFQEIQDEMRSQYSIGYTPTNNNKDGSYRKLEIKTKRKATKVQARKGYYASRRG